MAALLSPKLGGAGKAAAMAAGLLSRPPSTRQQISLAAHHGSASPGKVAALAAHLPPSAATSSCGPTSLVGESPGAPSAVPVPTLSFKEVVSCQGFLSDLHALVPKVASLQGPPL
jgi:hypothetical protein